MRTISFNFRLHLVLKYLDCDIFCSGRGVEEEEMKVTVSFNTVKIVVPCGDGEKTVRELTQLATIRYDFLKKASQALDIQIFAGIRRLPGSLGYHG